MSTSMTEHMAMKSDLASGVTPTSDQMRRVQPWRALSRDEEDASRQMETAFMEMEAMSRGALSVEKPGARGRAADRFLEARDLNALAEMASIGVF